MEISSPLPPPETVSAAILAVATSQQPRTVGEGLNLLRSAGIGIRAASSTENDSARVVVEATEPWLTTDSGLMLSADGVVEHFWSHLWVTDRADTLRPGFTALVEAIDVGLGAADDKDFPADGSPAAYWKRRPAEVELYLHAERLRAPAAVQIGITWAHSMAGDPRVN